MKIFDSTQSLKFLQNSRLNFQPVEFINTECIDVLKEKYLQYPGEIFLGLISENTAFEMGVSNDNQVIHSMLWRLAGEFAIGQQEYIGFVADPDYLVGELKQFIGAEIALVKEAVVISVFASLLLEKEDLPSQQLFNIQNLRWCELIPDPDTGEIDIMLPGSLMNLRKEMLDEE